MRAVSNVILECRDIQHWFGDNKVLYNVNLRIFEGEIAALVGPSGCGKSTLLRAIVGTHPPRRGSVLVSGLNGGDLSEVRRPGRDRGIVYQQYSLFPFLTARENTALGLMLDQTSLPFRCFRYLSWRKLRREHLARAQALLAKLKMESAGDLYPHEMSGGMRQRIAIAQALIMKPRILLLDEPFGALDEATREELQRLLLTLYEENCRCVESGTPPPYTILIVTHELNEAIYVGDRVIGLSQYWNWMDQSHDRCPGATIVYDNMAPVFTPDMERKSETFYEQRMLIRQSTFEPDILQPPEQYVSFEKELGRGKGNGVLA